MLSKLLKLVEQCFTKWLYGDLTFFQVGCWAFSGAVAQNLCCDARRLVQQD
jgi:hypothetical protein